MPRGTASVLARHVAIQSPGRAQGVHGNRILGNSSVAYIQAGRGQHQRLGCRRERLKAELAELEGFKQDQELVVAMLTDKLKQVCMRVHPCIRAPCMCARVLGSPGARSMHAWLRM